MSKNKKHDAHGENKPAPNKAALTVGDYVMFKPESGLTRKTYGTNVGLLCAVMFGPATEINPDGQVQVLFAGQLITLDLNQLQLRNY